MRIIIDSVNNKSVMIYEFMCNVWTNLCTLKMWWFIFIIFGEVKKKCQIPIMSQKLQHLPEYKAPQNYITGKRVYLLNTIIFTVTFLSLFYSWDYLNI